MILRIEQTRIDRKFKEITVPSWYQVAVGRGTAEFMTLAGTRPLKGLDFTAYMSPLESHFSGFMPSWYSFLRTCYSAASATSLLKVRKS